MTVKQAFDLMTQYRNLMVQKSEQYELSLSQRDYNSYDTARYLYLYLKEQFDLALEKLHRDTEEIVVI